VSDAGEVDGVEGAVKDKNGSWEAGVVPRIILNSDDGFGLGIRGTLYWHRWGQRPYKTAINFQSLMTTRLVQDHYLGVDAVRAFNLPLRLTATVGAYLSRSRNYCGIGNTVTCDPTRAEEEGRALGLDGDVLENHVRNYYLLRTIEPYGEGTMRYIVDPDPVQVELFGGWRGIWYIPGTPSDDDGDGRPDLSPYPSSLYAQAHPKGEGGPLSQLQMGAAVDHRDHELDPTRGYFAEASLRGGQGIWGSKWDYGGTNLTVLGFFPLLEERRLTLASRTVVDVLWGDPPFLEMARTGGISNTVAFGGAEIGRGLRAQRLVGRVKLMQQLEARGWFFETDLWAQKIELGWALFTDLGHIRSRWDDSGEDPTKIHLGGGASLRLAWNENFIMRLDLAMSPDEPGRLGVYSGPNHPY
jgi:hypothetical protein